jgi:hypothetical protein
MVEKNHYSLIIDLFSGFLISKYVQLILWKEEKLKKNWLINYLEKERLNKNKKAIRFLSSNNQI